MISMIACVTRNHGIGYKGKLLINSKKDMKHFTAKTKGKTVVMGYETWKSLSTNVLLDRVNIVTFNREIPDDLFLAQQTTFKKGTSLLAIKSDEILKTVNELSEKEEVVIIGGQSMYETFIPYSSKLYITYCDITATADRYFPIFNTASWETTEKRVVTDKIDKHLTAELTFLTLERDMPKGTPVTYMKDLSQIMNNVTNKLKKSELVGARYGY